MADNSAIEWTDATVNFWWGCTKVGPGCDHCYAEAWDKRTGGSHWGTGVPRRKIKGAISLLHRLDNGYSDWAADATCLIENAKVFRLQVPNIGISRRVFIQSMSDLFDLEVPVEWFDEAWATIYACNRLDIQIVTKRVSAVEKRIAEIGSKWPMHAGLIITVVNQDEADRDIPRLLNLKAKLGIPWVGLSCEPLLGPISLTRICLQPQKPGSIRAGIHLNALAGKYCESGVAYKGDWDISKPPPEVAPVHIDWVISGGESGPKARPAHPDWHRALRDQCAAAGVPYLFKQWGEFSPIDHHDPARCTSTPEALHIDGGREYRPSEQFRLVAGKVEGWAGLCRIGKKTAGRLLDGIEHNGFPERTR